MRVGQQQWVRTEAEEGEEGGAADLHTGAVGGVPREADRVQRRPDGELGREGGHDAHTEEELPGGWEGGGGKAEAKGGLVAAALAEGLCVLGRRE